MTTLKYLSLLALAASANAHMAIFTPGMFCLGGPNGNNANNQDIVYPLYQMTKSQWWFHAYNGCTNPPPDGQYMDLPAGGQYVGEIANNQGFTTLSFGGKYAGDWPDGNQAPVDPGPGNCISQPLLHTENHTRAAGTALAIADVENLDDVTPENLVVFSVAPETPWTREVTYDIPADMPACTGKWCICAWGWVPNHCGQPNMYMTGHRCRITGATSTKKIGTAQAPKWCENDESECVTGPKQMIFFNQADGNNMEFPANSFQADGQTKSPGYNMKCGFKSGAQNDIFTGGNGSSGSGGSGGSTTTKAGGSSIKQNAVSTTKTTAVSTGDINPTSVSHTSSAHPTTTSSVSKHCSARNSRRRRSSPLEDDKVKREAANEYHKRARALRSSHGGSF